MANKLRVSLITVAIVTLFSTFSVSCQELAVEPMANSYLVDEELKMILWNPLDTNLDMERSSIQFNGTYTFDESVNTLSRKNAYTLNKDGVNYTLYLTKYALIAIDSKEKIQDDPKVDAMFRYYAKDSVFTSPLGIEWRGNVSIKFPKKSYDIEFREAMGNGKSKDVDFKGLRKDDDFVLDAMYNEPLRMCAKLSQDLWLKMHTPHYSDAAPKANSGVDGKYVEVFENGKYQGVYMLLEQVDRKLLKIKKQKDGVVRGELFKASYYQGGTDYSKSDKFNNAFPTWLGFEMKYPYKDYTAHWDDIYTAVTLVANGSATDFNAEISTKFDIDNLIDYYLFINVLRGTDNLGKNYYLARYDVSSPYFIVPWDLDGTLGVIIDGRRIPTTNDILTNNLFKRLWDENPDGYREKVSNRWQELRGSLFNTETLLSEINAHYTKFSKNLLFERERLLWENTFTQDNLDYTTQWLTDRMLFLDTQFISK